MLHSRRHRRDASSMLIPTSKEALMATSTLTDPMVDFIDSQEVPGEFAVTVGDNPFDFTVGRVVAVDGDTVVWTPVYSRLHQQVYAVATLDRVKVGAGVLDELAREEAEQQAAETWAEDGWLRAAEAGHVGGYDPREL